MKQEDDHAILIRLNDAVGELLASTSARLKILEDGDFDARLQTLERDEYAVSMYSNHTLNVVMDLKIEVGRLDRNLQLVMAHNGIGRSSEPRGECQDQEQPDYAPACSTPPYISKGRVPRVARDRICTQE